MRVLGGGRLFGRVIDINGRPLPQHPCHSQQLEAQSGGDAASDMRYSSFPVTVGTGVQCSLQGYPVIHLASPARAWSATSVPLSDFVVPPGEIVDSTHPATIGFRWVLNDDAGYDTNTSMQIHVPAAVAPGTQLELEWEPDAQGPSGSLSSSPTLTVQ